MGVALVPRPRRVVETGGEVDWALRRVVTVPEWRDVVDLFLADVAAFLPEGARVEDDARDGADLIVGLGPDLGAEEFRLRVDATVVVDAGGPAGAAYALGALAQMIEDGAAGATARLTRSSIEDGPAWGWRGVHLDVARHFFSVDDVCRLIDLAAMHRLNRLHLHLNDDQGWRVEVPDWPRLTSVGAWRASTPVGHESDGVDDHVAYGGFYTAEDLAVIREHARRRFVVVVPEIDLPGHAQAVLAAYPELGDGGPVEVWTRWGISEHVLEPGEDALAFAEDVTCYVAGLFPASPVHVGGDECPTTQWERSERARAVMDAHGFSDPRELQGLFTARVAAALRARGHEVLAWDEVLDAPMGPGVTVVAWRGVKKGAQAARAGHDVVMAPMTFLYFDWLNADAPGEPVAQNPAPHATTWEKVYGFRVVPDGLEARYVHHVRGAQAELWSEYIATRDHLDYMAFPRLSAFAEVVWGTAGDPAEFRTRLEALLARLSRRGVRYRALD